MTDASAVAVDIPGESVSTRSAAATVPARGDSFPELVWVHHQWERFRRKGTPPPSVEREYRGTLAAFEARYGELVEVYWCQEEASAVAVTAKGRPWFLRALGIDPIVRFHQVGDWETRHAPAIATSLHLCETQAVKVAEVLRGSSERIAMLWIYSIAQHLLGFVERHRGDPDAAESAHEAARQHAELVQVEDYYHRASAKAGRLVYVSGMVYGLLAVIVLAVALVPLLQLFGAFDRHDVTVQEFFVAYGAGAIGAVVSVLSRMTSTREGRKFAIDFEVGRPALRWLGSFRPFLGAIFGLVVYFALRGQLIQVKPESVREFEYYTVFAFLAGFSERFTQVILGGAEKTLKPTDAPPSTDPEVPRAS